MFMGKAVGTYIYMEEVCYWEDPLSEVPLYFLNFCFFNAQEVLHSNLILNYHQN